MLLWTDLDIVTDTNSHRLIHIEKYICNFQVYFIDRTDIELQIQN